MYHIAVKKETVWFVERTANPESLWHYHVALFRSTENPSLVELKKRTKVYLVRRQERDTERMDEENYVKSNSRKKHNSFFVSFFKGSLVRMETTYAQWVKKMFCCKQTFDIIWEENEIDSTRRNCKNNKRKTHWIVSCFHRKKMDLSENNEMQF